MSDGRACGGCTLCCELPYIEALEKPNNVLCPHAVRDGGCAIYEQRPGACRAFLCHWKELAHLGEEWRPDRCGFYLQQPTGKLLMVMVDPARPDAWRAEPFYEQIKAWAAAVPTSGIEIFVSIGERLIGVFPEEDLDAGTAELGVEASMAYLRENGRRRPAVARRDADGRISIVATGRLHPDRQP